jgi:hypothetical protein
LSKNSGLYFCVCACKIKAIEYKRKQSKHIFCCNNAKYAVTLLQWNRKMVPPFFLLSVSGRALSVSLHHPDPNISFVELHWIARRATPSIMAEYKIALQLYKMFNHMQQELDWDQLNWSQTNATHQITFGVIERTIINLF